MVSTLGEKEKETSCLSNQLLSSYEGGGGSSTIKQKNQISRFTASKFGVQVSVDSMTFMLHKTEL